MPSPYNITNIPAPRVDFIDPRTGLMAREWYRFFFNLFNLTGAGTTDTSLADLQMGPPAINAVLGELGITYDQAQLASMMAEYEQATRDIQNLLDTAPAMPQLGTMAPLQQDNIPWLTFDNTPENVPPNPGTIFWEDGEGTLDLNLKGGNVACKIGEQQYARAYNDTALTMTKGQVVYISGAQGNRVAVKLAKADGDANSAHTIGFVAETIAAGGEGWVQVSGPIYKINTLGTTAGDTVYLSPTTFGEWTTTKPVAPDHLVIVGFIERVHASVGSIYIKVDNGYEIDELHNVRITSVANNDLLQYDSSGPYWKNVAPSSISIGTATNLAGGAAGSVPYQTGAGATTFLSLGTASQVLQVNAGATAPEWVNSTGTGNVVRATSPTIATPTFTTSATFPLHIGGTGTTSTLTLRSTSGVGTTGADIIFQTGNNGATEAARIVNAGNLGVGTASPNILTWFKAITLNSASGNAAYELGIAGAAKSFWATDGSSVLLASFGLIPLIFRTDNTERFRVEANGNVLVTGVGGLGYGTGSGGAVTQTTSRTTGVTLNKTNGAITLVSAAGTTTWQTFTVTNSTVAATDTIIVNQKSGTDLYQIFVTNVAAGSFKITFATTGGTTTEQPVFNFAVIKAVTA